MKKLFPGFLISLIIISCTDSNQQDAATGNTPDGDGAAISNPLEDSSNFTTIEWIDSSSKNLGKVMEGQKVEITYHFKNTGDKSLVITDASASCGCTVPNPPKEPIAPGQQGKITAEFNSQGRAGTNIKEIFVTANTTPSTTHTLKFQVEVTKKEN